MKMIIRCVFVVDIFVFKVVLNIIELFLVEMFDEMIVDYLDNL